MWVFRKNNRILTHTVPALPDGSRVHPAFSQQVLMKASCQVSLVSSGRWSYWSLKWDYLLADPGYWNSLPLMDISIFLKHLMQKSLDIASGYSPRKPSALSCIFLEDFILSSGLPETPPSIVAGAADVIPGSFLLKRLIFSSHLCCCIWCNVPPFSGSYQCLSASAIIVSYRYDCNLTQNLVPP